MPTVNYGIASTADDVTETRNVSDGAPLNYSDAFSYTGVDGGQLWVGLRFLAVAVPAGSTITSATLTLKRDDGFGVTGTTWGSIAGYAADTVGALTSNRPYAAAKTSASVAVTNSATVAYDVTAIVAEIIGRGGWVSGNNLAFATIPTGANGYYAWIDRASSSTNCAQLSITYSSGPTSYTLTADRGLFALTGIPADLKTRPKADQYFRKFPRFRGGSDVWYDEASVVTSPEFWDAASAGSYVLTASTGSFSLSGQAAGLRASRKLVAAQGAFALSGQPAALRASRKLAAASGSFTLTGQPANLVYTPAAGSYTLTADTGSFSLTGQAAGLRASRKLIAAQGTFALTGIAAVLRASRKLVSAVGSFVLTGQTAGLRASRKLTAAQGSFSLAGQSVNLRVSRKLGAGQGSFSLSGQSAGLRVSRKIVLDAGAFTLTGQDAGLVYTPAANSYTLTADFGAFTLSGQAAGLRAFRKLTASRGLFTVSGQAANLTYIASFEPFVPPGRRVSIAQRNRFVSINARERSVEAGQRSRFIQTAARVRTIDISPRKRAVP